MIHKHKLEFHPSQAPPEDYADIIGNSFKQSWR